MFFSEDYTNTEYLEIDEEDIKEDEEIIPLEFNSMTKVIRVSKSTPAITQSTGEIQN